MIRSTKLLNDDRDAPMLPLIAQCLAFAGFGVALFFTGPLTLWLIPLYYLVLLAGLIDRYTLMLHCVSHRPLFRPRFGALNAVVPVVLAPFFGQTPRTYFAHHLGMHHRENNGLDDLSSTMMFDRDRFVCWLLYFGKFMTSILFSLPLYHWRRGRKRMAITAFGAEALCYLAYGLLLAWKPLPTLAVFVVPFFLIRALMMMGNWGQHAFIDPEDPADEYRNAINCIDCRYNVRAFNDGYHIEHHLRPTAHFTDLPKGFEANRAVYGARDALVFRGIDFFQVWLYLMLRRYDWLAKAYVRLPGAPDRSHEEIVALLKARTRAIRVPAEHVALTSG